MSDELIPAPKKAHESTFMVLKKDQSPTAPEVQMWRCKTCSKVSDDRAILCSPVAIKTAEVK